MFNEKYMRLALKLAKKAYKKGEIPVGAVIVYKNKVISKTFNKKEKNNCALYHAEVIAIKKACKKLKNWRLENCDIYVTLEPCPMCASLIHQSRISNVYFGANNKNEITKIITEQIYSDNSTNFINNVCGNYFNKECSEILSDFFEKRRKK